MNVTFRAFRLLALVGLTSCSTQSSMINVPIENITLAVPENVHVFRRSSMEDFDLYECSLDGVRILSFYLGNAPSFPHHQDLVGTIAEITTNGMKSKDLRSAAGQVVLRETLVEVSGSTWPRFVHFWYDDLSRATCETADGIINSVRSNHQP